MNNKYQVILLKLQMELSNKSIEDLEIYKIALIDYIEQRKLCELMCGGVEDECNI